MEDYSVNLCMGKAGLQVNEMLIIYFGAGARYTLAPARSADVVSLHLLCFYQSSPGAFYERT